MTIASAFNDIAVAQGGTAAKSGAITAAIDALNDALAGSDQPTAKTIEQAVRLLGEHIGGGGGGVSLGNMVMFGVSDGNGDSIMAEYRVGIGASQAVMTLAPEMVGAAGGTSVDIVIMEIGGDPVTGGETVSAEFMDGESSTFTDFTKSLKDDALHIEFTMPSVESDEAFLAFTVEQGK